MCQLASVALIVSAEVEPSLTKAESMSSTYSGQPLPAGSVAGRSGTKCLLQSGFIFRTPAPAPVAPMFIDPSVHSSLPLEDGSVEEKSEAQIELEPKDSAADNVLVQYPRNGSVMLLSISKDAKKKHGDAELGMEMKATTAHAKLIKSIDHAAKLTHSTAQAAKLIQSTRQANDHPGKAYSKHGKKESTSLTQKRGKAGSREDSYTRSRIPDAGMCGLLVVMVILKVVGVV